MGTLDRTSLHNIRQPRGTFVWKFEKPGFGTVLRTTLALTPGFALLPGDVIESEVTLTEAGKIPPGMVKFCAGKIFEGPFYSRL